MLALITARLVLLADTVAVVAQGGKADVAVKLAVCSDEKWMEAKPRAWHRGTQPWGKNFIWYLGFNYQQQFDLEVGENSLDNWLAKQ